MNNFHSLIESGDRGVYSQKMAIRPNLISIYHCSCKPVYLEWRLYQSQKY